MNFSALGNNITEYYKYDLSDKFTLRSARKRQYNVLFLIDHWKR